MKNESKVSKEEKEFYIKHYPLIINKNLFRRGYINTLAKEKGSGRNILFYTCYKNFMDANEIGKILIMASAYKVDVLIIFTCRFSMSFNQVFKWLERITKENISFLLVEISDKNF